MNVGKYEESVTVCLSIEWQSTNCFNVPQRMCE